MGTVTERSLSMAATLHLAIMTTPRSEQERQAAADAEAPTSPTTAIPHESGEH